MINSNLASEIGEVASVKTSRRSKLSSEPNDVISVCLGDDRERVFPFASRVVWRNVLWGAFVICMCLLAGASGAVYLASFLALVQITIAILNICSIYEVRVTKATICVKRLFRKPVCYPHDEVAKFSPRIQLSAEKSHAFGLYIVFRNGKRLALNSYGNAEFESMCQLLTKLYSRTKPITGPQVFPYDWEIVRILLAAIGGFVVFALIVATGVFLSITWAMVAVAIVTLVSYLSRLRRVELTPETVRIAKLWGNPVILPAAYIAVYRPTSMDPAFMSLTTCDRVTHVLRQSGTRNFDLLNAQLLARFGESRLRPRD